VGFSKASFEQLLHEDFSLHLTEGQRLALRLDRVRSRQGSPCFEAFSLEFLPPEGAPPLPDGSYLLEAPGFGPEWIHISATHMGGFDPAGYFYESVFNVIKP